MAELIPEDTNTNLYLLKDKVLKALHNYPEDEEIKIFREYFIKRFKENLLAVVFFGSCLSEKTRSETSFKDFFVILKTYLKTSINPIKLLSHKILPPDLYHLSLEMSNGKMAECKFYLLSEKDLMSAVSDDFKDLYVMGRFSKRVAIIYAKDKKAEELVRDASIKAMLNITKLALVLVEDSFNINTLLKTVLGLSYRAETRLEDERKVDSLYSAHSDYYEEVYSLVLEELSKKGLVSFGPEKSWSLVKDKMPFKRVEVEQILAKSRKRAKMRWPKMIITVDNWLDQLLAKLERTYGIKLEIPAWERPIVLITGWRHYFRLKREGKIH